MLDEEAMTALEEEINSLSKGLMINVGGRAAKKGKDGDKDEEGEENVTSRKWTAAAETVLAQCSEKAAAFRWMHNACSERYKKIDWKIQIPMIVVSSLTGGVSLSLGSIVPEEHQTVAQTVVGCCNLAVGCVGAISQFIKAASLSEAHRAASISWGRLGRRLMIELSLEPELRTEDQESLLKSTISTYDNLMEQGPPIDRTVINMFKSEFQCDPPEPSFSKPEIISGPYKVRVFGHADVPTPLARRNTGLWTKGMRAFGLGGKKTADNSPRSPSSDQTNSVIT